jgi:hypothetical protein
MNLPGHLMDSLWPSTSPLTVKPPVSSTSADRLPRMQARFAQEHELIDRHAVRKDRRFGRTCVCDADRTVGLCRRATSSSSSLVRVPDRGRRPPWEAGGPARRVSRPLAPAKPAPLDVYARAVAKLGEAAAEAMGARFLTEIAWRLTW